MAGPLPRCFSHNSTGKAWLLRPSPERGERMAGRITTAVVLAAGRGTRLHPITNHRSKAMLPILGVPMIERILQTLASNGLKEFIIVARPDDHQLIDYFKSQSPLRRQSQ